MNVEAFTERDGELYAEGTPLRRIAEEFGTPCFVYSRAAIERQWRALDTAFGDYPHLVCYAVKANSNLAVLDILARLGSGFDIVSGGELERVRAAGGDLSKVIFSGVGKTEAELRRAIRAGLFSINVESVAELERLQRLAAEEGVRPPVALRVNPDVDANTHRYIATGRKHNKFGISMDEAPDACHRAAAMPDIQLNGIACHIGSQWMETAPVAAAAERVLQLAARLRDEGVALSHLDLGGGLGVRYRDETPPPPDRYVAALLAAATVHDCTARISIEPGRIIVAAAGVLLTRIEYLKHGGGRHFAVVDAAMNDLLRPALYDAWHEIRPPAPHPGGERRHYDIVGPVCESADFLGLERELCLAQGELLAVMGCGAYAAVMGSNYNSRPRPPEVVVDGADCHLCRARESVPSLFADEAVLPR